MIGSVNDFYGPRGVEPIPEVGCYLSSVSNITSNSAILNGSIYVNHYSYSVYSAYWETDNPSIIYFGDSNGFGWGDFNNYKYINFSLAIEGLKKNTKYSCVFLLTGTGIQSSMINPIAITTMDN